MSRIKAPRGRPAVAAGTGGWRNPLLAEAVRRYPLAFTDRGCRPRPLKLGIAADLRSGLAIQLMNDVRRALDLYCGQTWYQEALAAGGARIDLEGNPAGEVDEVARRRALEQLLRAPKAEVRPCEKSVSPVESEGSPPVAQATPQRPRLGLARPPTLNQLARIARGRGFKV